MRSTKLQLLTTIAAIIRKYDKCFCFASQATFIKLLGQHYHVHIKVRQLNYHLADLRRMGLIKSIKRHKRNKDGTICLQTSATCLTPKGYYELFKLGVEWAKKRYMELIAKYFPKNPKKEQKRYAYKLEDKKQRWELGKEMFNDPDFRTAFGLDE